MQKICVKAGFLGRLSYLLIRGLMRGLSPNLPICSSSSTEMDLFVMHYGIKALEIFVKVF